MKINNSLAIPSFSARLNPNTRQIIKDLDRVYKQNVEHRVDLAIQKSPLADFYDNEATISFLETENPYSNIAPAISMNINGITSTYIMNGSFPICEEQDEEFLLEKMQRKPHSYVGIITNRLSDTSISKVKKGLAIDYLTKTGNTDLIDSIDEKTFDKIIDCQI